MCILTVATPSPQRIAGLLSQARDHHPAGRLAQAEQVYREMLQHDPRHADALHLLGLIAYQTGHHSIAVALIGRAIESNPDVAAFYSHLGLALQSIGRIDE